MSHHGPCNHDHGHNHSHSTSGHHHAPATFGKAFAIGIALNTAFVAIEAAYGILSNSVALVADAGHNLSDVLGLALAWLAYYLGTRKPSRTFTYGLGQSTILAALFNAMFLLIAVGIIGWQAVLRLITPQAVEGTTVMAVAACGIVVNGFTAWLFSRGHKHDINIKGAYLHMLADAGISLGVVVAGFIISYTGWLWVDPTLSLAISAIIVAGTWSLLKESASLSLAAAPTHINTQEVKNFLLSQKGVQSLHDLHIWSLSTTQVALTCHLVMPQGAPEKFLAHLAQQLNEHFAIAHTTLQVEKAKTPHCANC